MNEQTKASTTAAQGPYFGPKGYGNDAFEIQDSKQRVVVLKFCDAEFANRVLATLNACEGIPIAALLQGASGAIPQEVQALRAEVARLREALLGVDVVYAELQSALPAIANTPSFDLVQAAVKNARAALAAAAKAA